MDKLWLIIQREYKTRVFNKKFFLITILTPLLIAALSTVLAFIISYQSDDKMKIAIVDESNIFQKTIKDTKKMYFTFYSKSAKDARQTYLKDGFDALVIVPPFSDPNSTSHSIQYVSKKQININIENTIERTFSKRIEDYKIKSLGLDENLIKNLEVDISINPEISVTDGNNIASTNYSNLRTAVASGIGGIMGFLMYLILFINGSNVMRSVMEEKTNRIVEVMISSVKPMQLMLGKIIAVTAVGITQIIIWIAIFLLATTVFQLFVDIPQPTDLEEMKKAGSSIDPDDIRVMMSQLMHELTQIEWWYLLPMFILYFLGGLIIYSSLFAAVGSAVGDDIQEGQSLVLPITIPIILAFYIMTVAVRDPDSPLALWSSIFPLFSPIVMPARLAFSPPIWQVLLSVFLLILGVWFFVWLSGRIYRVGILMYGKKASFKELGKWIFYKE